LKLSYSAKENSYMKLRNILLESSYLQSWEISFLKLRDDSYVKLRDNNPANLWDNDY